MTDEAVEFVGGPEDGQFIVVHASNVGFTLPVLDHNGQTFTPPLFAAYKRRSDGRAHFVKQGSFAEAFEASFNVPHQLEST